MLIDVSEDGLLDENTLKMKINVLFDGSYSRTDQHDRSRTLDGTKMNAVEAREEIIKWGENEFGLSELEKEMIHEIYQEIDEKADPTFSREELFKHLRDITLTLPKSKKPDLAFN